MQPFRAKPLEPKTPRARSWALLRRLDHQRSPARSSRRTRSWRSFVPTCFLLALWEKSTRPPHAGSISRSCLKSVKCRIVLLANEGWSEYSVPMVVYRRAISSREAMSLTFFSSVPFIPKKVAISTICLSFTKSFGSEQNFSIVGPKSGQLIPFGMRRPILHSPLRP